MKSQTEQLVLSIRDIPTEKIINNLSYAINEYLNGRHTKSEKYKNVLEECALVLIQNCLFTSGPEVATFLLAAGLLKLPYDES